MFGSGGAVRLKMATVLTEGEIQAKLVEKLQATHVEVTDFSDGCGYKFNVVIVSPLFEGKQLLERHRMVNNTLGEEMKTIHALTQKTYTPDQWDKIKQQ